MDEAVEFIKSHLIPEMVHERCFCEKNSREFVEFESAWVDPVGWPPDGLGRFCETYRAEAVVRFSGEPFRFRLLVKLLGEGAQSDARAFEAFQNEEMFYSKMGPIYQRNYAPKCYLADLGRYGRPVIVLEDLEAEQGYRRGRPDDNLDQDHLKLCVQLLGSFHGRGLKLRAEKFNDFREFYAKLSEISLAEESLKYYEHGLARIASVLERIPDRSLARKIREELAENPLGTARNLASEINEVSTICHGHFSPDNLVFKYQKEKPIDGRVIDWQTMRYCSAGVDLGRLLLANLPPGDAPTRIEEFLTLYLDEVKREYPEIEEERFRQDVLSKFLFAGIILSFQENITQPELVRIFLELDRLRVLG